ncbi:MAG TPA: GDP-mannose 4,6-dehydratase [archaeon]|nr:GDP-mannose 4,6-dehydratase [archaeon]
MERFLVTGMNGAIAPYVAEFAHLNGAQVIGTTRNGKLENCIFKKVPCVACDITNFESVKKTVKKTKPDVIVQLAGISTLAESWKNPLKTLLTNAGGPANFLESLRQLKLDTRLIVVGSREEYGNVPRNRMPINENENLNPVNPYGVTKAAADYLARQYFDKYEVQVICARPFNQTGPIWPERFVDSNWCKQIAQIEAGKIKPELKVGKLDSVRDFTDCRDVARAYWLLAQKGKIGEAYNICSGKPVKMASMLKQLLSNSNVKVKIKKDSTRIFKEQVQVAWGDNSKLRQHTGWKPEIPLENTHNELLAYWRELNRE